ncbi:MAG: hypothetical protein KTR14_08415 [Vampirovibrio sp.]|nr:hypothetical protein [Vampirovibrio sp.]
MDLLDFDRTKGIRQKRRPPVKPRAGASTVLLAQLLDARYRSERVISKALLQELLS